jgi:uncharacterized protein (DUF1800 family)
VLLLALVAVPFLSGCGTAGGGGGGGGGGLGSIIDNGQEFGGNANSVSPYRDRLTSDEAYYLLRAAAFGATPQQVERAVQVGLFATVDDLLETKSVSAELQALEDSYEDDIPKRWLAHLIEGPNPLHEQMAMFWHDRFAASRRVLSGRDRNLAVAHWNMLRSHALGNYRDFLEALTIDPLMLIWLDGANSPKSNPNENYTREFWELFTLGRDVLYTEGDIREGARAFTGITLLRESDLDARPIYDIVNHDETDKLIFPDRADADNHDYLSVIDLTLGQPEAAEYVARNLFIYFVHDQPSAGVVRELAQGFADSGFDIAPLARRILTSSAMFSSQAVGTRIRTPVEHVVGVARTFDMHLYSEESQGNQLNRLVDDLRIGGHDLLNPPGVQGWGENAFWLEDQWVLSRVRALSRTMEYGPDHTPGLPLHLLPPVETWGEREAREALVQAAADVFHLTLTDEEKAIYVEVLDQNGWLALHLAEPDQRPRHVFEMVRLMAMDERVMGR